MKRFLIHVDTNWCGEEDTFRAVAESEIELWDIAEQLAYDNFYSFGHDQDIAEEEGYDPDEMTDEDWDEMWSRIDETAYYSFSIEEAVKLVKDGDVDCTDMEEFYEDDDYLSPQENGGRATHEIYSAKDDVLLYSNKGECTSLMGEMGL